jgi:DNA-binding NtrC family response regulator
MNISNKVMIFEKDSGTVNAISRFLETINLELKVMYNWTRDKDKVNFKEIVAILIDIEMPMLPVDHIISTVLEKKDNALKLTMPVAFFYSNKNSKYFNMWTKLPHTQLLQKPAKMEDIFHFLYKSIDLDNLNTLESKFSVKLSNMENYVQQAEEWIDKIAVFIRK